MWNLRFLKMSVMLVTSGVALVAALPAKAQQVVLTPAGTFAMQPKTMEEVMGLAPGTLGKGVNYADVLREEAAQSRIIVPDNPQTQEDFVAQVRSGAQFILDNPGFIRPNQAVSEVLDAQGKVVYTKDQVIEQLRVEAANVARNPESYGIYTSAPQAVVSSVDFYKDLMPGITLAPDTGSNEQDFSLIYGSKPVESFGTPVFTEPVAPERAAAAKESFERMVSSGETFVVPTTGQANQVRFPLVTLQASQNPTTDFATTRSAPRNTVPDQLNQGIINSPLSSSRIFPGMR